jgi:hypothetical protein
VVHGFADHFEPQLLDKEAPRLRPVLDPNLDMVEADETKVAMRSSRGHVGGRIAAFLAAPRAPASGVAVVPRAHLRRWAASLRRPFPYRPLTLP